MQEYLEQHRHQLEYNYRARSSTFPYIVTGNAAFQRAALEEVGLFDESFRRGEDLELSWKLILSGYQLSYASDATVVHHCHDSYLSYMIKQFHSCQKLGINCS